MYEKEGVEKAVLGLQLEGVPAHGVGFSSELEKVRGAGEEDSVDSLT